MIQKNNCISCLPFYTSLDEQNHRKTYAYGDIYPLFTPANKTLPFQIIRPTRNNGITRVTIYNKNGTTFADVTQPMQESGLQIVRFPQMGYDVITYPGVLPMSLNQPEGIYYIRLTDGAQTWFSEMYTVVNDMSCYLSIEWYDEENLEMCGGQIIYDKPRFRNILYLATELGKPDYVFEEEGEERDGYFFPEKQISEKTYKCTILAPEYLCDVMRFIRMADYVVITDKYGRKYDCDTFLISPKWQAQGDLASVEIEFQTDTVVKKIGKGYKGKGKADYTYDFNADYLISLEPYAGSLTWEPGGIDTITGNDNTGLPETRRRTKEYIRISDISYILFDKVVNNAIILLFYKSDGYISSIGWLPTNKPIIINDVKPEGAETFRILIKYPDITPENVKLYI